MNFTITKPNQALKSALVDKINHKTKPLGALGMLEAVALQIGLMQQSLEPKLTHPTMLVFASDHGIVEAGVSPYPQAVTAQMVLNFLQGGAAINVFTTQNNIRLRVVDAGVNHQFADNANLINAKIAPGTRNFLAEAAMTTSQCESAIEKGAKIVDAEIAAGCNVFAFGEMGIGNTSSASCLMSVLCGLPLEDCVGRGTGLDDAGLHHKTNILAQAIAHHALNQDDAEQVLATFGGFEIAMMVGAMLQAAASGCTLLIDGFITTAALLVAAKLQPNILHYCVFTHCSNEAGHQKMLAFLNVKPLLNIDLRLGEGTGAALAYPLVNASVNFLNQMASFESAKVSQKT
ncbi:MAG: nicotinate-nucleotide--dimethylbenzimidazole phosphoribosyltransferase [Methylotenera sp.]|jgi:nicotinate-nucleotide--dimethylbenzimidazole phosphoribosyltransferase|nr:nicotinate-nucleotide--dimethylbenzimidazole phosphoribosyltransferase [Methylotenera sp.]HPH08994.1 nicotinate-nucleotide--dimethylbenzimidazole phosphoribosyltransferase [Methylotenera sp.]HPM50570.1 nicotinate-nucleotide--dimethylbenzimidazole phosphoribosyltransferase [Methylotenera sp.]